MVSIGNKLDLQKGVGPGFDFLRIALATSVVAFHTVWVLYAGKISDDDIPLFWLPEYAILAMFFALSGFLITASAQRLSLPHFMINRGMRIIPALGVEVVLAALILGPLFTILPLSAYFSSPKTFHYLTNVVGWVNFYLPGVFAHNPSDQVNNALWTIPYEYGCYALMAFFIWRKLLKRPALVVGLTFGVLALGLIVQFSHFADHATKLSHAKSLHDVVVRGAQITVLNGDSRLFPAFLFGVTAYLYRYRLPYDWRLFAGCAALILALVAVRPYGDIKAPLLNATLCPILVYMTAFLGVTTLPLPRLLKTGDYSYGIYLYGFPVQQALVALSPLFFRAYPLAHFLLAIASVSAFAAFSWHFIEKPILKQRRRFSFMARERLAPEREHEGVAPEPAARQRRTGST